MPLPATQGTIERRLWVNFRVDPTVMSIELPSRFAPQLHQGYAIAGIRLIRLEARRSRHRPKLLGVSSENAAHRVAVRWSADSGEQREGVFIPRRDTNALLNRLVAGWLFPAEPHRATFAVQESADAIELRMHSADGKAAIHLDRRFGGKLPEGSCFASLEAASALWRCGTSRTNGTARRGSLPNSQLTYRRCRAASWAGNRARSDA